jgi:hypothetical protein
VSDHGSRPHVLKESAIQRFFLSAELILSQALSIKPTRSSQDTGILSPALKLMILPSYGKVQKHGYDIPL